MRDACLELVAFLLPEPPLPDCPPPSVRRQFSGASFALRCWQGGLPDVMGSLDPGGESEGAGAPGAKRLKVAKEEIEDNRQPVAAGTQSTDVHVLQSVAEGPGNALPAQVKQEKTLLLGRLDCMWAKVLACSGSKPLAFLRDRLADPAVRANWAMKVMKHMKKINPEFGKRYSKRLSLDDVKNESVGHLTEGHALVASFDKMHGTRWPAFWKKDPSADRLRQVWTTAIITGRGMDMATRTLKLCISEDLCNEPDIRVKCFYAGYTSGSTLGGGCLLLFFLLTLLEEEAVGVADGEASQWQLPEVQTFIFTSTRLPVKFVLHASAVARMADALSTKITLNHVEETHGLIHANALIQSKASDTTWVWNSQNVDDAIAAINDRVGPLNAGHIGTWKRQVIVNVILDMPRKVVGLLQQCYDDLSWERSWMNEDLLRSNWWKVGRMPVKCVTPWKPVYTTTESALERLVPMLHRHWLKQWGSVESLREMSVRLLSRHRPANVLVDDGCGNQVPQAKLWLMQCLLIDNWLLPEARKIAGDSAGNIVEEQGK